MSDLPILYSFRRCPYAMRARLGIWSSGLTVELREVVLRNKPQAMIEVSPKATVPVLVLPNGTVIDESIDIMRYALSVSDPEGIYQEHSEVMTALISANDGPFKAALDRYKYADRDDPHARNLARDDGAAFIGRLDKGLVGKAALLGDRLLFADDAILPFVRQFAHVDRTWFEAQPWLNVIRWLDTFKTSARFNAIMEKRDAWREGDQPVLFGRNVAASDPL